MPPIARQFSSPRPRPFSICYYRGHLCFTNTSCLFTNISCPTSIVIDDTHLLHRIEYSIFTPADQDSPVTITLYVVAGPGASWEGLATVRQSHTARQSLRARGTSLGIVSAQVLGVLACGCEMMYGLYKT